MTSFAAGDAAASLRSWLTARVAVYLDCPPGQIDPARSLAEYGLHSVLALALGADIEDRLCIGLEPTFIWDHPTIDDLVAHLSDAVAKQHQP
ncbi:acyl carrier protein [Jidongwangia harbinensis]|uniref:acyl carrier protein n=1 Tax=Jidongwangia harbinensis TaxID=2878561 RepID=UPI001CD98CEF|nr:acyl carrier protein [Jidongwangia harbinensis]MCA2211346.1 acyl carrier protein [Jidongwangia harbinensis]